VSAASLPERLRALTRAQFDQRIALISIHAGSSLREAFAAALRALPTDGARTVFDAEQPQHAAGDEPAAGTAVGPAANPLAALVGDYSDGDGDEEDGEDDAADGGDAKAAAGGGGNNTSKPGLAAEVRLLGGPASPSIACHLVALPVIASRLVDHTHTSSSPLTTARRPSNKQKQQLESFMEDLHTSGLLEPSAPDPQPQPATADGPAEQRTLGFLAAAPEWCKVLDTGSGKIYFWNTGTNEVIWDAPSGMDGDELIQTPQGGGDPPAAAAAGGGDAADDGAEAAAAAARPDALAAPSDEVEPVLHLLQTELRAVAQPLLAAAPAALRMLIQLDVLQQQWSAFAHEQRAAAATSDASRALGWQTYEQSVMRQLQGMFGKLQPALEQLQRRQEAASSKQKAKQSVSKAKESSAVEEGEVPAAAGPSSAAAAQAASSSHSAATAGLPAWAQPHYHNPPLPAAAGGGGHPQPSASAASMHALDYSGSGSGFDYAAYAGYGGYGDHHHYAPVHPPPQPAAAAVVQPLVQPPVQQQQQYAAPPVAVGPPHHDPSGSSMFAGLPGLSNRRDHLAVSSSSFNAAPFLPPLPDDPAPLPATDPAPTRKRPAAASSATAAKPPQPLAGSSAKRGRTAALMDRWSAVQRDLAEEEEARRRAEEELDDPDARARVRKREVEAWRVEQLRTGASSGNANFTPLGAGAGTQAAAAEGGSVKRAKKKAAAAGGSGSSSSGHRTAAKAAAADPQQQDSNGHVTHGATKPDLAALSVGLPPGWLAMWDAASGAVYYGDPETKVGW